MTEVINRIADHSDTTVEVASVMVPAAEPNPAKARPVVYLVQPRGGPMVVHGAAVAYAHSAKGDMDVILSDASGASWERNQNGAWYDCLNKRDWGEQKPTHFAMIHADVCPPTGWLDVYLEEMERLDADVLSGVISFRDDTNLTSTAIEDPDYLRDPEALWAPRRLTIPETNRLPETFSIRDTDTPHSRLLFNTGLMLINLRGTWQDEVNFQFLHRKCTIPNNLNMPDGTHVPQGLRYFEMRSEDWELARFCHDRGLKVYCTRKLEIKHVGNWMWSNTDVRKCRHCHGILGQTTDELFWNKGKQKREHEVMKAVQNVVNPQLAQLQREIQELKGSGNGN